VVDTLAGDKAMNDIDTKLAQLASERRAASQHGDNVESSDYVALPDDLVFDEPNDYKFFREYIRFSERWSPRSPAASHEAVALHLLSAAAAGRVVYEYGGQQRTSLYQLLVADSTLYAKTTVARLGHDLLIQAGLERVIIGKGTPQSFFDRCLEKVPDNFDTLTDEDQQRIRERLQNAAQRAWLADEFGHWAGLMLKDNSPYHDFRQLLLEVYGSPHRYESSTRTYGYLSMRSPTLALFALSTWSLVRKIAGAGTSFWNDGMLARFDFITTAPDEVHTDEQFPDEELVFPAQLVDALRKFDIMLGRARVDITPVTETLKNNKEKVIRHDVKVTPPAPFVVKLSKDVYAAVGAYERFLRKTIASGLTDDLRASYGRMPDRALRVACLLAAFDTRTTCEMRDWKKAQCIVERGRQSLHWAYDRLTSNSQAAERVSRTDSILSFVRSGRCVTARDIQTKFRRQYPSGIDELTRELDALVKAGELHCVEGKRGRRHYAIDARSLPAAGTERASK
jgi:hypothetical protein